MDSGGPKEPRVTWSPDPLSEGGILEASPSPLYSIRNIWHAINILKVLKQRCSFLLSVLQQLVSVVTIYLCFVLFYLFSKGKETEGMGKRLK